MVTLQFARKMVAKHYLSYRGRMIPDETINRLRPYGYTYTFKMVIAVVHQLLYFPSSQKLTSEREDNNYFTRNGGLLS